jgi:predicted alpha/beta hydrolase family esterase
MSKFTPIQDYEEFMHTFAPLFSELGDIGHFLDKFVFYSFHKYYEIKNSIFKKYIPGFP